MWAEVLSSLIKRNGWEGSNCPAVSAALGHWPLQERARYVSQLELNPWKTSKIPVGFFVVGFTGPVVYFEGGALCSGEV